MSVDKCDVTAYTELAYLRGHAPGGWWDRTMVDVGATASWDARLWGNMGTRRFHLGTE